MTKHLRFFMLTLLTIVCTVGMAQDETVWKSLSFPDDNKANNKCQTYAKTWTAKIGDDSWSVSNFNNNNWNWTYIKCGSKNNASVAAIVNDVAYTETVTKVVVKIKTASSLDKVNSVRLITASDKKCNNIVETIDGSFGSNSTFTGDLTFNVTKPAKNLFYKFVIDIKKATNGIISISGVDYYISNSETSTPPTTTTFGANSGKTFTFTNGTLEGFTAPTAIATKSDDNTDLSNLIEYTSSDADIVAVDSKTGELTFTNTKFGKATITATLPKTDTYQTSTDSYIVENIDNHIATSLSFNGTDITLTEGKTDAGTDFTGYTATEASNIAGTITYAASGDAVATVNPTTGAVTVNATTYGTTTITATFTPADPTQYSGSTATYQITNKKAVDLSEITFDVKTDKTSKKATGKDQLTKSIVKIESTSAALGGYGDYRFYGGSKTTFSLTDPTRVITSIKFVGGSTYDNFTTNNPNYDKTTGTWTGYEESVIFTNTSASKIDDITQIIVTTAEKKPAPALSFAEATVTKELVAGTIDLQIITKPEDLDASAITYASSDNTTAKVEGNTVHLYKTGEVTITATSAATDKYIAGTASYKLLIEDNRATDTNFKFAAESYSADLAEATEGIVTFNAANVLQNPHSLTVTYTISPESANATIGETDGEALIKVSGTYTITATAAANNTYKETTATCTLKVINSAVEETSIKFVAGVDKGTGKDSNHAQNDDEMRKSFVKITSDNAWFDSTQKDNYRFYAGTHTISTKIGKITKIEFVEGDKPITNLKYNGKDGKFTADTKYDLCWVGSAKEVVFTNADQARATNITVTVEVPKAKNYTLDETKTDNVIETYENANVTLQRTLEASHWNSFCVPFALDKDQVTQYFGEGTQLRTYEGRCENNIVYFATVDNIEAGKPYIMKPGNAVVKNPTFEGVSMVATGLDKNGNPQAVGDASTVQMKGIYNQVLLRTDKTELFLGDNDLFYYPINNTESRTIGGLRAYFIVPQGTDIKKLRANLDGTPTSLGTIFDTEESNAPVYNLQGQYVGNSLRALKSGIYIQNGKKVAVK
jgi:cytochrome c oxidase assembly protein Cox11